ncbi:NAD(P)/FAD-dependent oxidoreductase [Altericroceibacterium spongiae]|uniref:NAD(P)/FAD-dependent oxidoreductase n=2 Tax=Altericroceibacterium spongiae TaxID=2320269 RepID=A0A420EKQ0_9SPHN|nr:NAD(P)/FAD-dependent oxidoreductase [Altericroceibacterium spongiae]
MGCPIARRDFLNGTAVAIGSIGAASLSSPAMAGSLAGAATESYPPAKTGMRGSHPGSFEVAHLLRDGELPIDDVADQGETYDLVIVGGGISGLSAAHFYRKLVGRDARILILENHDDFGGHAKRNEFMVDGKLVVINGGTLNIEAPQRYNRWARQVLDDMGIDAERYRAANTDTEKLYSSMGLRRGHFFDKETWKKDRLVVPQGAPTNFGDMRAMFTTEFLERTPLSPKARADMMRLVSPDQPDYLAGMSVAEKKELLATTSFRDYYLNYVKLDPEAMWFFQQMGNPSFCVGADATPALFGWVQGYPGFESLGLGDIPEGLFADLPGGQHGRQKESWDAIHFPDGNATLARLLVSSLVPNATKARTQEDMGTATFDYGKLDLPSNPVRIRLSSIVVNVRHDGDPATATEAVVTYANGDKLKSVRGKSVILACWNMVIPYMMPELPAEQQEALHYGVKGPLVYTSVALRNWKAFKNLGVSTFSCPTMFHDTVALTEAVDLGALSHARSADQPIALHLTKFMNKPGLPRRDQHRVGRAELLEMSFETFERETRSQLARLLGPAGFDPARDIAAITVNRWPHGYAYTYNSLYDPVEWVYSETNSRPCVVGRQPYGLISIANSDAAASPHTDAAILEAHRAVSETIERETYPFARRT